MRHAMGARDGRRSSPTYRTDPPHEPDLSHDFFTEPAVRGDACCCGKGDDDPTRCACTGDPEQGVDCCCASA